MSRRDAWVHASTAVSTASTGQIPPAFGTLRSINQHRRLMRPLITSSKHHRTHTLARNSSSTTSTHRQRRVFVLGRTPTTAGSSAIPSKNPHLCNTAGSDPREAHQPRALCTSCLFVRVGETPQETGSRASLLLLLPLLMPPGLEHQANNRRARR